MKEEHSEELMSDDELDMVVGGTYKETMSDLEMFDRRGVNIYSFSNVTEIMESFGYRGYVEHAFLNPSTWSPDKKNANVYVDKQGNKITREQFWENFDAENGTSIVY